MTDSLRYVELGGQRFSLEPGEFYAQNLEQIYGKYNTNGDETLTEQEILSGMTPEEGQKAAEDLAAYASTFSFLAKMPTSRYSFEQYQNHFAAAVANRLQGATLPQFAARSTMDQDARGGVRKDDVMAIQLAEEYSAIWGGSEQRVINTFGIENRETIRNIRRYVVIDPTLVADILDPVFGEPLRRIVFADATGKIREEKYIYAANPNNFDALSFHVLPIALLSSLIFIDQNRDAFEKSAFILDRHHPQLPQGVLGSFLAYSFTVEFAHLQGEDFIQDVGACSAVDCAVEDHFSWFDRIKSSLLWQGASLLRYDKKAQGYGPGQIILGLALEAAKDRELLDDYAPHLLPEDFQDEASALRAILDPIKSVYVKALTIDYVSKKLEETLFAASVDFELPINWACPLQDRSAARAIYFLMLLHRYMALPEGISNVSEVPVLNPLLPSEVGAWLWVGELSRFPMDLPGVMLNREEAVFGIADPRILQGISSRSENFEARSGFKLRVECR